MKDPEETLKKMKHVSDRIEAVAEDIESGRDRFAEIDPYALVELLGLHPDEGSRTEYIDRASLDARCDPVYCYFEYLEGKIPNARIRELTEKSKLFEKGESRNDADLNPEERRLIEDGLSQKMLEDGGGWFVARQNMRSSGGIDLEFEAEVGDGGECFGCYGPYQIRDGNGAPIKGLFEGESW